MSDEDKPAKVLLGPIFNNNPIALQVLGICSALAVTSKMEKIGRAHVCTPVTSLSRMPTSA